MPLPRESVYPFGASTSAPSSDFLNQLEDCINNTQDAVVRLSEAVTALEPGVADLPRLNRVLTSNHRFLVLPAPTIQARQAEISASIAPQIQGLIARAEALIESQAARVSNLEERLSILQSRHQTIPPSAESTNAAGAGTGAEDGDGEDEVVCEVNYVADINLKELTPAQRRKYMVLKQKRAKLEREWKAHLAATGKD